MAIAGRISGNFDASHSCCIAIGGIDSANVIRLVTASNYTGESDMWVILYFSVH